jgi:hypothetical protein
MQHFDAYRDGPGRSGANSHTADLTACIPSFHDRACSAARSHCSMEANREVVVTGVNIITMVSTYMAATY